MVSYIAEDIIGELSSVLQGTVEPERDAALVDIRKTHEQLMDVARLVFILNPGAIHYLAKLVRNTLYRVLRQELAIAEDMMLAIDTLENPSGPGRIGTVGPSQISNARTILLSLEFAEGSMADRPELARFSRIVDSLTEELRTDVTSAGGDFMLPRTEAREVLKADFIKLRKLHSSLLTITGHLKDLLANYKTLHVPASLAQRALVNMRKLLAQLQANLIKSSSEDNQRNSRRYLLRLLTLKVVADLLAQFTSTVSTTPLSSASAGQPGQQGPFLLQAAGEGVPAQILTSPSPWKLDTLSTYTFAFTVDGSLNVSVDLSVIQGPGLHGRNKAPFYNEQLVPTWPGPGVGTDPPPPPIEDYQPKRNLHIAVDSNQYEFTSMEWFPGTEAGSITPDPDPGPGPQMVPLNDIWTRVRMYPPVKLGFKHLGAPVYFVLGNPESSDSPDFVPGSGFGGWSIQGDNTVEDMEEWSPLERRRWHFLFRPRVITDLCELDTIPTLTYLGNGQYQASGFVFEQGHVGFYIRPASLVPYEIIRVINSTTAVIDTRDDGAGVAAGSDAILYGSRGDYTEISFSPDLLAQTSFVADTYSEGLGWDPRGPFNIPDTCTIRVGPTVKTAQVPLNNGTTISTVIAALKNTAYGENTDQEYAHASYHVIFKEQTGHTQKITIQNRSRHLPDELAIAGEFTNVRTSAQPHDLEMSPRDENSTMVEFPGPYIPRSVKESGHEVFGFDIGQRVDPANDPYLSAEELLTLIEAALPDEGIDVDIFEEDVFAGVLNTQANTFTVSDSSVDFDEQNLGFGFLLEIQGGNAKGIYIIESASNHQLTLVMSGRGFVGSEVSLPYRIFTQRVRISSQNAGPGSSVQITTAPTQFDMSSSIIYGTTPAVEAVNADGDRLDMSGLAPGDSANGMAVDSVAADGSSANIVGGVSSSVAGLNFAFSSYTATQLEQMLGDLYALLESRDLLGRSGYGADLDTIDRALTPLLTPGVGLQANTNQARQVLSFLIGTLTSAPRLEGSYRVPVRELALNIEDAIKNYDAPRVPALDSLMDSLNEYRFDRALALLVAGDLAGFFETTAETATFPGALLRATRDVVNTMASASPRQGNVEEEARNTSTGTPTDSEAGGDV